MTQKNVVFVTHRIPMNQKKKIYLSITFIGIAMKFEKEVGFLLAYIFGKISPKINIDNKLILKAKKPLIEMLKLS